MRKTLSLVCLVLFLGLAMPAQAQFRETANEQRAPTQLYDSGATGFLLNTLFNPAHFQMRHSFEMSIGSFGGHTSSLGMYTNSLMWQFNDDLAARVDLSVGYSPFNEGAFGSQGNNARVFLRNAEIAYRPAKNVQLHVQVRQSPYGAYARPYGYYSPYGYSSPYRAGYDTWGASHDLFWKDNPR